MKIDPLDAHKRADEDRMIDNANDLAALHAARVKGIREAAERLRFLGASAFAKRIDGYADGVEKQR